jgi:hypothetical protein
VSNEHNQENTMTIDGCLTPPLEVAIRNWQVARLAFQGGRSRENQDCYMLRSDELGQGIGAWAKSEPELAYQFGLWFQSHEGDWAGD